MKTFRFFTQPPIAIPNRPFWSKSLQFDAEGETMEEAFEKAEVQFPEGQTLFCGTEITEITEVNPKEEEE
jgi:hypothetical protein